MSPLELAGLGLEFGLELGLVLGLAVGYYGADRPVAADRPMHRLVTPSDYTIVV